MSQRLLANAVGSAAANTSGRYNVTLGAGSGNDYIDVGTAGDGVNGTTANYQITGMQAGDRIYFNTDRDETLVGAGGSLTATADGGDEGTTIANLVNAVGSLDPHGVACAVSGGNTYLAESIAGNGSTGPTDTSIVKIMGVHTFTVGPGAAGGGYVQIASWAGATAAGRRISRRAPGIARRFPAG